MAHIDNQPRRDSLVIDAVLPDLRLIENTIEP